MRPPETIRAVIVDDEPLARSNLRLLLQRESTVDIVAECGSGPEAPELIRRTRPDLLFLDVQMPECDGFDVRRPDLELLAPPNTSSTPTTVPRKEDLERQH